MKHRRKIELLIADIRKALAKPASMDRYNLLSNLAWDLVRFDDQLAADPDKLHQLLAATRAVRAATGPGRSVAEERIMECLATVGRRCADALFEVGERPLPDLAAVAALPAGLQQQAQIVVALRDYAYECLRFQAPPREAFAGLRRRLAFELLEVVGWAIDLPEALEFAQHAVRRNSAEEMRGARLFLDRYLTARKEIPLPDAVREALWDCLDQLEDQHDH